MTPKTGCDSIPKAWGVGKMVTRAVPLGGEVAAERLEVLQEHRAEILEQLNRLLGSQLFRTSRYYPKFLQYVVQRTLDGHSPQLKERALGVEVFGRDPDYDTNLDPVVRTSACEVRKRIALYYQEPGRQFELRIDLPTGSYVPEFRLTEPPPADLPAAASPARNPVYYYLLAGVTGLAAIALGAAATHGSPRKAVDQFWAPVWSASEPVLICIGGQRGIDPGRRSTEIAGEPSALEVMRLDRIAFSDAVTMGRLFRIGPAQGKRYEVRRGSASSLVDLRRGPAVLVGAFNNPWTMRLTRNLRYTFDPGEGPDEGVMRIRDQKNPSDTRWRVDGRLPFNRIAEDYAIVSRMLDPLTERMVVTIGGVTSQGTIAAGEFVTEERYLSALRSQLPPGWERKNMEVVLGTELVNGVPGPPRILARWIW